ncbi:MAG: ABC transporter ATP-binding protein, partial [Planctomycetota bacterium]
MTDAPPTIESESEPEPGSASPPDGQPIVRLLGVHKRFARHRVLRGITLGFPTGRTTVVLGPSGCGKSVMLKHIIGLLQPDKGQVWFENTRLDTLRESQLVAIRRQIGFLFQHGALFDSYTVGENVAFPLAEHTDMSRDQRLDKAAEM